MGNQKRKRTPKEESGHQRKKTTFFAIHYLNAFLTREKQIGGKVKSPGGGVASSRDFAKLQKNAKGKKKYRAIWRKKTYKTQFV